MAIELDQVFVCTSEGAPEAEHFLRFGLLEGAPNRHAGQGKACRRFDFANAMFELLWVSNPKVAKNEATRRTVLWDRWSARGAGVSPFGVCVRPVGPPTTESPFPAWEYRPAYLPDPLVIHLGEGGLEEPTWFHLGFARRANGEQKFKEHSADIREITGLRITTPVPFRSAAAQTIVESRIVSGCAGTEPLLEIEFDDMRRNQSADFGPQLSIVFRFRPAPLFPVSACRAFRHGHERRPRRRKTSPHQRCLALAARAR